MTESPSTSPLVSPTWLADQAGDPTLLVIDVRPLPMYLAGHIPGAISLDVGALRLPASDEATISAWTPVLEQALKTAGITPEKTVIFTEDISGTMSAFGVWLLDIAGLHNGRMLDGGLRGWVRAGGSLDRTPVAPLPSDFTITLDRSVLATASDLIAAKPGSIGIVDTRSANEHENGTIPGAVHREWMSNLNPDGTYRSAEILAQHYQEAGLDPEHPVATFCAGGFRAAQTYVALRAAGFTTVRNYAPSWSEWGQLPNAPVAFPDDDF